MSFSRAMKAKSKHLTIKSIRKFIETKWLGEHTKTIDSLPKSQLSLWIAVASGLGLFVELMMIRVHSSYFQLFAYLKNVSLLSCFLGLGIGYALAKKRRLYTPLVLPLLSIQIIALLILRNSSIAPLLQNPFSEQLSLGLSQVVGIKHILLVFGFVVTVFAYNALCFIPLGHLASYLMSKQKALPAYSWNLIGSFGGILLFSLLSLLWLPPLVWFLVSAILLLLFTYKDALSVIVSGILVTLVTILLSLSFNPSRFDIYSPYQILTLTYYKNTPPVVMTSNSYYQKMLDLSPKNLEINPNLESSSQYYSIPYFIKPNPDNVLVVGSGTGNDVAAALRNGAGHVDAVEIDPAILDIGRILHPEAPYLNPKVKAITNDARSYIRYSNQKYDLIVYGLLDSHTLLSGRGGIRLDSYVYTVEAFREAKSRLNEGGTISLTFALLSRELGDKLYGMLKTAFDGQGPVVYYSTYDGGYTFLAGKNLDPNQQHPLFENVTPQFSQNAEKTDISTDDWPFFYMPYREYPISSVVLIAILLLGSIYFIKVTVGKKEGGISLPFFFLGAGFMLLETKGITELALNYGSTWYVNSIVIIFILIMGFLANIYIIKRKSPKRIPLYFTLFASIFVSLGFTYVKFIDISWLAKIIMPIGLTLPLFFSGLAFSSELDKSGDIGGALYSNLLGAMLGGFLEYNSMYFGFRSLYYFAFLMYLFALLFRGKYRLSSQ